LPEEIQIEIIGETVPYVETKKIHASQNIIERKENGNIIISLFLIVNYELISNLLALGEGARVIKPQSLRHIIGENLRKTLSYYHV
jgi:predicted DNA-binding transcriptional regulator YafY